MPTIRYETWLVDRLLPYAQNARTHSDEQVAEIAGSIAEYGVTNPPLVTPEGELIAGHGRTLALKQLGWSETPVLIIEGLSELQIRHLRLADNRIALNAGWDEAMLASELQALLDEGMDLAAAGFSDDELAELIGLGADADQEAGLTDEDAVPELPEEPTAKLGDVWLLGRHKVICGDSTRLDVVEQVLDGSLADMVFCDPPYNVNYANSMKDKLRGKDRPIANDNLGEDFYAFLYDACVNMLAVTKGAIYVAMSSSELHTLQKAFVEAGGKWSTFVIWAKNTFTLGRADYQRQYEPILYGWKDGNQHFWCGARDQGDVWFVNKPVKNDLHPTMKPVELVERAIQNSSKTQDIILDLFGGSGSTLIAAERTGRTARLVELEPKYVDVIVKRWEDYTGKKAELLAA